MSTWSEKFDEYIRAREWSTQDAAREFEASTSQIHAWRRDGEPRDAAVLKRIERKSKGLVPAEAASRGQNRRRAAGA